MRINTVKKAQKAQGSCDKCGKAINIGDSYRWFKHRRGGRHVRCAACPMWRSSELTQSSQLATIYGAQESAYDEMASWDRETLDDAKSILTNCAENVREAGEEYRTSASSIEDGFGHSTYVSDELNEKGDSVDSWADEMDSALDGIEEWDEDAARSEVDAELEDGETLTEEEAATKLDEKREEWADSVTTAIDDVLSSSPF